MDNLSAGYILLQNTFRMRFVDPKGGQLVLDNSMRGITVPKNPPGQHKSTIRTNPATQILYSSYVPLSKRSSPSQPPQKTNSAPKPLVKSCYFFLFVHFLFVFSPENLNRKRAGKRPSVNYWGFFYQPPVSKTSLGFA